METRYLKCFPRATELPSTRRAAESLGRARPSLSQQLLRLENEVGFKLFNRAEPGSESRANGHACLGARRGPCYRDHVAEGGWEAALR